MNADTQASRKKIRDAYAVRYRVRLETPAAIIQHRQTLQQSVGIYEGLIQKAIEKDTTIGYQEAAVLRDGKKKLLVQITIFNQLYP